MVSTGSGQLGAWPVPQSLCIVQNEYFPSEAARSPGAETHSRSMDERQDTPDGRTRRPEARLSQL